MRPFRFECCLHISLGYFTGTKLMALFLYCCDYFGASLIKLTLFDYICSDVIFDVITNVFLTFLMDCVLVTSAVDGRVLLHFNQPASASI